MLGAQVEDRKMALLIDDDEDFTAMAAMILGSAAIDAVAACGGSEALTRCVEISPDVILLDLHMPGMPALDAIRELRRMTAAPILLVTASGLTELIDKAMQLGADDFLAKPFTAKQLIAKVAGLMARAPVEHAKEISFIPALP
ncbi:MAG: response regulator [Anaerolineae bacterium]|nr:response regulator [Anaerolineae bacterium]